MDKNDAKLILAYVLANMNICEAARKTYYHRNTFTHNLERIRKVTGLNPRNFFDLHELYDIACSILTVEEIEEICEEGSL